MKTEDPINILMVDDSPTNLLALETILQAPDRNLIRAESGDDALRFLLDNDAAVILLDVFMPGIDGLDTAALIRGRERSRDTPIIFLTADSTGGRHLSRGYALGAVDYIVKPIEPEILRSKVGVFVELFKKNREVERQAELLKGKNIALESDNLSRLAMLIDLGHELASEREPERVLKNFCRSARRIVGAQEAAIGLLNEDGDALLHFFRCGANEAPSSDNLEVFATQRALKLLVSDRRAVRLNESDALLHCHGSSDGIRSLLGAPILTGTGASGWVCFINKLEGDDFSEADERLAATLATQVAIAYENARLYSEVQQHASDLQLEVAERKQAEEERAELLIREQEARAEAELANRTKDEFLATLSHELRTPLSAILGWSHLVRTGKLDEPQMSRAFETIERNARSQSQLIDDLLDVSRIITGKLEIELQQTDLCAVVEASIEAVRPSFEGKNIEIKIEIDSESCLVDGDANRLQQILWNLLNNAVKFTPAGGEVRVKVQKVEQHVRVSVTDTGIGISSEFIPYIFDRFRQADGSTTRNHGGLGLGLAIVRYLVQLHHGTVSVKSDGKDKGSTFTVEFPSISASATPKMGEGLECVPENGQSLDGHKILDGLRVLVVDDEADARELMSAIVTRCGGEVRCSESAADAIEAFREWDPDVLVTDIGMPVADGYSLIRQVRELHSQRAKEIPALAVTAYVTKEDRKRALSAGFRAHLAKPVEPQALVNLIAEATGRKE